MACPSRLFNFNGSYPVTNSVQASIMGRRWSSKSVRWENLGAQYFWLC